MLLQNMRFLNNLLEYTLMFCIRERSVVSLLISQNGGAFPRERLIFKSLVVHLTVRSIARGFLSLQY